LSGCDPDGRIMGASVTSFFANTRIMHKVLAVLLLFGAVTIGLAALTAFSTSAIDRRYSQLIQSDLPPMYVLYSTPTSTPAHLRLRWPGGADLRRKHGLYD
jgi:hypothetical protein